MLTLYNVLGFCNNARINSFGGKELLKYYSTVVVICIIIIMMMMMMYVCMMYVCSKEQNGQCCS